MKSTKANVVASYGDPRKPKAWPHKRIRREFSKEFVREILEADSGQVESTFDNIEDMIGFLNKE